jgi:Formyltetrahydrofolate synthetase
MIREYCEWAGVGFAVNDAFARGGKGAEELANLVVKTIQEKPSLPLTLTYKDEDSIPEKIEKVAKNIYGAKLVTFSSQANKMLKLIKEMGICEFPVCIAKTPYSFSADEKAYGVATDFELNIRDIVINNGAEMIVAIAGDIMRMPGLPKDPQATRIDIVNGFIDGLS